MTDSNKPVILLTNDDGINAPGINALFRVISRMASVEVVAPETQCSATGHAVSVLKEMSYRRIEIDPERHGHMLTGMPADCVKLAITRLFETKPDLVISGINRGSNLSNNILYSGTVAAALEAVMLGVPAMAVSLDHQPGDVDLHYETAAEFTGRLVPVVLAKGLPPGVILNVNVPNLNPEDIKGVMVTRQGKGMFIDVMEPAIMDGEIGAFRNVGEVMIYSESGEDCDDIAVRDGYISITPLQYDLTHYAFRKTLEEWLADKTIGFGR